MDLLYCRGKMLKFIKKYETRGAKSIDIYNIIFYTVITIKIRTLHKPILFLEEEK